MKLPHVFTGSHKIILSLLMAVMLSGCIGTVVGAVVDTTIEVAKVPFKVGGAIIDVMVPDKKDKADDDSDSEREDQD